MPARIGHRQDGDPECARLYPPLRGHVLLASGLADPAHAILGQDGAAQHEKEDRALQDQRHRRRQSHGDLNLIAADQQPGHEHGDQQHAPGIAARASQATMMAVKP